jgi:hypothetical protein
MSGAIPSLPQYAFMAWCSVKAQGQHYLYLYLLLLLLTTVALPSDKACKYKVYCFIMHSLATKQRLNVESRPDKLSWFFSVLPANAGKVH